jgi:hypothetical protein
VAERAVEATGMDASVPGGAPPLLGRPASGTTRGAAISMVFPHRQRMR